MIFVSALVCCVCKMRGYSIGLKITGFYYPPTTIQYIVLLTKICSYIRREGVEHYCDCIC